MFPSIGTILIDKIGNHYKIIGITELGSYHLKRFKYKNIYPYHDTISPTSLNSKYKNDFNSFKFYHSTTDYLTDILMGNI